MRPGHGIAVVAALALTGCRTASEPVIAPSWTEAEASRPLSHDDCVRLASHWAPNRAAWQARLFTAQAALHQACALPNPSFNAGWEDIGLGGSTPIQQTFSLAYALEGIFSRRNRMIAARGDLDLGEALVLAEWQKLAADVHRTYDTLVAMRAKVALQRDVEAIGERHRDIGSKYVTSGIAPRIGLDRAEAELAAARADRAKTETQARALELEFAFALGFAKPVPLQLSEPMTAEAAAPDDIAALLAVAAENRAELKAAAAKYRAEVARLQIAADRVQFLPTVTAGPRTQGGERSAVASIDVVLPVFDSGEPAEAAQRATLLLAAAEVRKAAQSVASDVFRAVERLRAETAYLETYAKDLAARRVALREQTERLFTSGEVASEDLIQARRDEVTARLALLDSELAVALARVDLSAALGQLERGRVRTK